jgi:2'-5' RNA ligase
MPEVRWVEPERFHLTLRFIGVVDDPLASDIATALQRVEATSFALTLAGVGHFHEHSLWVGVEPNPALMCLQHEIEQVLQAIGLPTDRRPYVPHVKLARLRRHTGLQAFLSDHADFRAEPFDVRQFSLIESQRRDSRTVYTHAADYPLACAAPDPGTSRRARLQQPWWGSQ